MTTQIDEQLAAATDDDQVFEEETFDEDFDFDDLFQRFQHSPFSADFIVKENAKRFKKKYKEAFHHINTSCYVDDFMARFS